MSAFKRLSILFVLLALALSACAPASSQPTATTGGTPAPTSAGTAAATDTPNPNRPTLTVMTHDSFAVSESLVRQFEAENNVNLSFFKAGDAGAALNRAILSKGSPLADVFYGVDNTFLSRALDAGIYEPYDSPLLAKIPQQFQLDPTHQALPVDYGDVCINYDKTYFKDHNLPVPQTLEDLVKPEYKGMLVMENPATSSPGLSFMLATIVHFGQDGWLNYWKQLKQNGLVVVNDWETAYYTNFSGSTGQGPQPLVVSYGSSPAAEVYYATTPPAEAPTASIVGPDACFRQIEFVGILKGTQHRALAEKFVDFMLSVPFQEDMPLQMFVFPVNPDAKLPEVYQKYVQIPQQPATMDIKTIAQNRDKWIQDWQAAVLQ